MAIRMFKCERCGCLFEALIRSADIERKVKCPSCDSYETRRTFLGQVIGKSGCGGSGGSGG